MCVSNFRLISGKELKSSWLIAVCLDGSPPAYHLHRGHGSGANNWLVHGGKSFVLFFYIYLVSRVVFVILILMFSVMVAFCSES
jgi:hypothetical protein